MWALLKNPSQFRLAFLLQELWIKVSVNEGEHVKKGQLLASLNSISFQNAYQVAEAKEKQATGCI